MLVFLGGAGAGLSALVNIFYELGFEDIVVVDKYQSQITDKLQEKGIKVVIGDGIYNFQKDDIIFYSDAVVNSKDFQKVQNNIKFTYFQFLGEISKWFQTIAIAGTHGKTSTTAMILTVAKNIGFDNLGLGIVGGFVPNLNNNNFYVNQNKKEDIKKIFEKLLTAKGDRPVELFKKMLFIVEADEFNKHFLLLDPSISLITKVDHDHKDVYPTLEDYLKTFKEFINKTKQEIFTNDEKLIKNIGKIDKKIEYVGINPNIRFKYMFGEHMKKNASLVIKLFETLHFEEKKIIEILNNFKGIWRRQEYLGIINTEEGKVKNIKEFKIENLNSKNIDSETSSEGQKSSDNLLNKSSVISIYTDYAHHPTEIEATVDAFKQNFPEEKIIGVFQPHQLFRFISYEQDFIESLSKFDKIYIYDIYSVREDKLIKQLIEEKKLNVKTNQEAIKEIGNQISKKLNGKYVENFNQLTNFIEAENGIVVIMTAGDLDYKMRKYLKK